MDKPARPSNSASPYSYGRGESTRNFIDQGKLIAITEAAALRIDELLDELGVKLKQDGRRLVGPCPIHGGNNPGAINLYPEGHTVKCNWKCRTHHCENVFKPSLIGFVRGVLSNQQFGWSGVAGERATSFAEAVNYVLTFLGSNLNDFKVDAVDMERRRFMAEVKRLESVGGGKVGPPRVQVRGRLKLPSTYFVGRGYSASVLDQFDVGEPTKSDKTSPFYSRVVVPVYDEGWQGMIGATGRSLWPQCKVCGKFHDGSLPCPTDLHAQRYAKWFNSFEKRGVLYGYWFSKGTIRETGKVTIVEGPGDVWRLWEAGVKNAVALMGSELDDQQKIALEISGAMQVTLLLDHDEAGKTGTEQIRRELRRSFDVRVPSWHGDAKDVGEMSVPELQGFMRNL